MKHDVIKQAHLQCIENGIDKDLLFPQKMLKDKALHRLLRYKSLLIDTATPFMHSLRLLDEEVPLENIPHGYLMSAMPQISEKEYSDDTASFSQEGIFDHSRQTQAVYLQGEDKGTTEATYQSGYYGKFMN